MNATKLHLLSSATANKGSQQYTPTHLCYTLADKHQSVRSQYLMKGKQANSFHLLDRNKSRGLSMLCLAQSYVTAFGCLYLVVLRNEVVYDKHLETKFPAQLPNIL